MLELIVEIIGELLLELGGAAAEYWIEKRIEKRKKRKAGHAKNG